MSGKDDDKGGFPEEVYRQMEGGHDRFMRDFERQTEAMSRESSNIFVSFKDFIDSQVSSMFQSFKELPNNISELRKTMQEEREARLREEQETLRRWTGRQDATPDHVEMEISRQPQEERDEALKKSWVLLGGSYGMTRHLDPQRIVALYNDSPAWPSHIEAHSTPMLSPGGACEYMRENGNNGYNMVSSGNAWTWRWPREEEWLSPAWFRRSPYSPVNLAAEDMTSRHNHDWKRQFEDLLDASLGRKLSQKLGKSQSESGVWWMLSLYRRGILPPRPQAGGNPEFLDHQQLHQLAEEILLGSMRKSDTPESELELLEQFQKQSEELAAACERDERLRQEMTALGLVDDDEDADDDDDEPEEETAWPWGVQSMKPDIRSNTEELATVPASTRPRVDVLSSLTTTQTTRLPDGTVTTKIVLKEKFADGREESHEKVHTYHESTRTEQAPETKQDEQASRKGGWFWT